MIPEDADFAARVSVFLMGTDRGRHLLARIWVSGVLKDHDKIDPKQLQDEVASFLAETGFTP